MYPYETPFGIIMKINRNPMPELSDEILQRDHAFWSSYSDRLIGNWITYDTSVKQIVDFIDVPDGGSRDRSVYRADWGRIVATLIGITHDFDLAEESAQEAFTAAVDQWPVTGIPDFPRAWIIQTARHKAIDRIRRQALLKEKLETYVADGLAAVSESRIMTIPASPTIAFA